ncbi:MAG: hypothetical protein ACI30H_08585 [Paludibacteraceae bacterium]
MKRIFSLITIALTTVAAFGGFIPKGTTIYLDVTQQWCCKKSYYLVLSGSRDGQPSGSYRMKPVPGKDGVYSYTTTSQAETQDNIRFAYSMTHTEDYTTDQNLGVVGEEVWWKSASTPYYQVTAVNGTGQWLAAPASTGASGIADIDASVNYDCATKKYNINLTVTLSGAPCGMVISCPATGVSKKVRTPKSPYQYVIEDVPAAEGDAVAVYVSVYADVACTQLIESKPLSLTVPAPICTQTSSSEECQADGATITLSSSIEADFYKWESTDETVNGATSREVEVPISNTGTCTYKVTAYKTNIVASNNLMAGGEFESTDGFTSSYTNVEYPANDGDYYNSAGHLGSNLYTLAANASDFWYKFESIEPHGGDKFGLFDAGASGYAWKAETECSTETDPKKDNEDLIVMADSTYYFSYWAAMPNTTGEAGSPAILQFYIDLNDGAGEQPLGEPYTLPTDDNEWHQQFVTYTAPKTSTNVMIGVKNLNDNAGVGNDFCLDDIMFQTISTETAVIAFTDTYILTVKDCSEPPTPPTPPCDTLIYRKWTDFLFVSNKDKGYTAYQWYLNGNAIDGATGQYYRIPDTSNITNTYYVEVTTPDGTVIESCHVTFDEAAPSAAEYPASQAKTVAAVREYRISANFRVIVTTYSDGTVDVEKRIDLY